MALSYIPFAYVLNYTSIVDAVFAKWMSDHTQDFIHEPETGFFVYNGKQLSVLKLQREFWPLAVSAVFEVFDWIRTIDKDNASYYLFVVNPREHSADEESNSKWKFNEEADIKLNFPLFEEAFQKVFDRLFKLQMKNKNEDILYIQVEDLSYNAVLNDVIGRLFGMTRISDLSKKFAPRHLTDASKVNSILNADENSISAVLEWVEQMTSLSAKI